MRGVTFRYSEESDFIVALGEDGNVYPISQFLIDKVEDVCIATEMGFDITEMIDDDVMLSMYFDLKQDPVGAFIETAKILPRVLGDIGLKLVKDVERLGFGLDKFKESRYQDCEYVLFATNAVEQSILGKDNYSFPSLEAILKNIEKCKNRKKFQNWLTKAEISLQSAIFNLVQMAICIKNNDYKFRIYLDDAIRDSRKSISSRHEYYGMRRTIVADSVMDHQMGLIITVLKDHDSWNVEIET